MSNKHFFLILSVIETNKNLNSLLREGLSYKMIGELTEDAVSDKLIHVIDGEIRLTELGENELRRLRDVFKKRNKAEWIELEKDSIIPKLDENFIYLPDQNELFF